MPSSTFIRSSKRAWVARRAAAVLLFASLGTAGLACGDAFATPVQTPAPAAPAAAGVIAAASSAEDVLAEVVHASGAIFAGEVYAIRLPAGAETAGTGGAARIPSTRPDAVDVEFRVDVAVRGTSVGSNYVLHMPMAEWQQGAPFTPHERAMVFLRPPDPAGLSGPVRGPADPAAQPAGVLPLLPDNTVDLNRLGRLVQPSAAAAASSPAQTVSGPATPPSVPDVSTPAGRDTLEAGSRQGRMPELDAARVPFLALVRDVNVLNAAEATTWHPAPTR